MRGLLVVLLIVGSTASAEAKPRRWNPLKILSAVDRKVGDFAIEFSAVKSGDKPKLSRLAGKRSEKP